MRLYNTPSSKRLSFSLMHFYLPRRHRRQLLFPPGLLALAGLLWLGCVVVGKHSDRLKLRSVMQFTMPPLQITPDSPFYGLGSPVCMSARKLESFRPWLTACFTGSATHDLRTQKRLIRNVRGIIADSGHAGGVRIAFAPSAHYKNLVFALDLMNREKVKQYWLDFKHQPATLYAYTEIRRPLSQGGIAELTCGTPSRVRLYQPPPTPLGVQFDDWATDFWQLKWLRFPQELKQPEWRASVWLFAAIASLSCWRIIRAWRMA